MQSVAVQMDRHKQRWTILGMMTLQLFVCMYSDGRYNNWIYVYTVWLHVGEYVSRVRMSLLWVRLGLFLTRDAGSVDWNPSGHQGHLIPPLPKHWTKCSCIIHVYITLLLCKVFTQSFCRTICCPPTPPTLTDKLLLISTSNIFGCRTFVWDRNSQKWLNPCSMSADGCVLRYES